MRLWRRLILLSVLGLWRSVLALDGPAILEAVDRNMMPESFEMYRKLINIDPNGDKREFVFYTIKRGRDAVANLFLAPSNDAGRITLRIGENMWLALPDSPQPIRVPSMHSVIGRIFSNWDLMHTELGADYNVASAEEGPDRYLLVLKAKSRAVAYEELRVSVDKALRLPTEIQAYTASGLHIKTLRFSEVKDFGDGIVRPSMMETESPLVPGYKAIMITSRIRRRDLPEEIFTIPNIRRIEDLR